MTASGGPTVRVVCPVILEPTQSARSCPRCNGAGSYDATLAPGELDRLVLARLEALKMWAKDAGDFAMAADYRGAQFRLERLAALLSAERTP